MIVQLQTYIHTYIATGTSAIHRTGSLYNTQDRDGKGREGWGGKGRGREGWGGEVRDGEGREGEVRGGRKG